MNQTFLKNVLVLDVGVTGVNALAYLLFSSFINEHFGYPVKLQIGAGIFLAVFVLFVLMVSQRKPIPGNFVKEIVIINFLWALASIVALVAGWLEATTLGAVWAVLQAVVVAGFGELQLMGLKRQTNK